MAEMRDVERRVLNTYIATDEGGALKREAEAMEGYKATQVAWDKYIWAMIEIAKNGNVVTPEYEAARVAYEEAKVCLEKKEGYRAYMRKVEEVINADPAYKRAYEATKAYKAERNKDEEIQ